MEYRHKSVTSTDQPSKFQFDENSILLEAPEKSHIHFFPNFNGLEEREKRKDKHAVQRRTEIYSINSVRLLYQRYLESDPALGMIPANEQQLEEKN